MVVPCFGLADDEVDGTKGDRMFGQSWPELAVDH